MRKKMCESVQKRVTYKEIGIEMAGSPEKADEKYFVDAKINRKMTHNVANGSSICTVCPKYRNCPHAHNAIELNYTKIKDKIGNLKNLLKQQTAHMTTDKPLEPWRPGAKSFDVSKLPDQTSKKKNPGQEAEEKEKRSILDRSNVFRLPGAKDD